MAGGGTTLEYTPTWLVAVVYTVIVAISLAVERSLHWIGKVLKKKNQKPLFQALQKIKEELMLLGFISLLLTVTQNIISMICMPKHLADYWLPCKKVDYYASKTTSTTMTLSVINGPIRRLLAGYSDATEYCENKGKVPMLSITALHHLHIFIFVLAVVHVTFCVLTIVLGGAKVRMWKKWEDAIQRKKVNPEEDLLNMNKYVNVQQHEFIKGRFLGLGCFASFMGWIHSFIKHLFASVTMSDYNTLRLGFIMTHCRGNPTYNFNKYMIRVLEAEADFSKVVGISWYLWVFVVVFLLLNVYGWNAYFWISFIPLILLLAVGTKLEHVGTQLADEVASEQVALELIFVPSDEHFWFRNPQLVLTLIHILLFQNSFELAVFFWILVQYGFNSCIMGKVGFVIPRLIIGVFVQFLCSFSTLPLYAIVTQMGTSWTYKPFFEKNVQQRLFKWAQRAKVKGIRKAANRYRYSQVGQAENLSPGAEIQLANAEQMEEGKCGEIVPENGQYTTKPSKEGNILYNEFDRQST